MEPAAMKWSGPFGLLLVLWFTAPSGQRVVPRTPKPSPSPVTEADSGTRSLLIELDEEAKREGERDRTTTTTTTPAQGAPLKIEIDMEETPENGTGTASGLTESAWHPFLIKISSGPPETTTTSQPPALMEETIVMQLPEPSPADTQHSSPTPLLVDHAVLLEEVPPWLPILTLSEQSESPKGQKPGASKKRKQHKPLEEGEPEKPKPEPPARKQKAAGPTPITKPGFLLPEGNIGSGPAQVFLVIKEVEPDSTTLLEEHVLPVDIQIIDNNAQGVGTNTSVSGISTKDADMLTDDRGITVKNSANVTNALGNKVKVPDVIVTDKDTVTKVPDMIVTDKDTVTKVPDVIVTDKDTVTKVPDVIVTDKDTVTKVPDVIVTDKDTVTKVPDVIVTDKDTVTKVPDVIVTDKDTVTKVPDVIVTDKDTVTKVPDAIVTDKGTVTKVPGVIVTDKDSVTKVPDVIVTEKDTVAKALNMPVADKDSVTKVPDVIVTEKDTVTKALNEPVADKDTVTKVPDVIVTEKDTVTKALNEPVADKDTVTKVPDVIVTEKDTVTKALNVPVADKDTVTKVPDVIVSEKDTVTKVPDVIATDKDTIAEVPGVIVTDKDTVAKFPDMIITDADAVASVPDVIVTDANIATRAPEVIITDTDAGSKVPEINITDTDTVSSTQTFNTKSIFTSTEDTNAAVNDNESEVDEAILSVSDKGVSVTELVTKVTVPDPYFKELYFNQLVDHFSFTSHQKLYRQRYLLTDQFWAKSFGPIFLYTGNEGDIWDFANSSRFLIELASELQAMVIYAEHRYYGKSLPFGKKSYEKSNIEFLTVEQAVADYVVLITKLKADLDAKNCAVIVFGGSYGGMLSAYMRIKYPNIVDGALASSAPVVSTANLGDSRQFFHDVTKDFERNSPDCVLTIRKGFQELEALAQQQAWSKITSQLSLCKAVKSKKEVDHLYAWARNAFTYLAMFNYPYKTEVGLHFPANPVDVACRYILKKADYIEGLLDILGLFYNSTGNKKCFDIYTEYIRCSDPTGCGLGSASQAWDFQACTEINLLFGSNNETDMFPAIPFTEAMRRNYCHSKWGVYPNPEWLKIQYWGDDYKAASNIIFSNGDLDPWANGGILKTMNPSVISLVIEGAAHHLDLRATNAADPPSVTVIRKMELSIIRDWVKNHQLRFV